MHYCDLPEVLGGLPGDVPVYGTFLKGNNIYSEKLSQNGVIVIGNEGNGISAPVEETVTRRLFIPPFPRKGGAVESLNASVAAAIICSEFRRGIF